MTRLVILALLMTVGLCAQTLVLKGRGPHIVLVSGDEEYRSEEALPQLARILNRQGFRCTVLFAIDSDGTINPNRNDNIPGLEALRSADLMILFTRFRDLPDEQMQHIVDYVNSGRPIVGLRTATHAFAFKKHQTWRHWSWDNKSEPWPGGFGKQVLGETWVSHHGKHAVESTRALVANGKEEHPILRGVDAIWSPTDVYTVRTPLPPDAEILLLGQVLSGMQASDRPLAGTKNDPMMPLAWTRSYKTKSGKQARVFTTTLGSAQDLLNAGIRRLLVNAVYWGLGRENRIKPDSDISLAGEYTPTPFKFNGFIKGRRP